MRYFLQITIILTIVLSGLSCSKKGKEVTSTATNSSISSQNSSYLITFIQLGSDRCLPCKMMKPILSDIGKEYAGRVKVVYYDVWTEAGQPYAEFYKIRVIPTQIFIDKNGREYFRHEGYFPREELVRVLELKLKEYK